MDTTTNQTLDTSPSRIELLEIFNELRRKETKMNSSNDKLIEFLGGIDAVMETVLSAPNHNMTAADCVAMHRYLKEPLLPPSNDGFKWKLDPKNNKLYQISPFVHRHLFSKPVLATFAMFFVFVTIVNSGFFFCSSCVWYYYASVVCQWLFIIPFFVAALFRVNMLMVWRILVTADFWILNISLLILFAYTGLWLFDDVATSELLTARILWVLSSAMCWLLALTFVCCLDGIEGINPKFKVIMMIFAAIWCAAGSFTYGFIFEEQSIKMEEFGEYGRISITGYLSNYYQVLAIFVAKMAVNTIRKGGKRCVLVKCSPFIEWAVQVQEGTGQ